jgi:hypothetical protein
MVVYNSAREDIIILMFIGNVLKEPDSESQQQTRTTSLNFCVLPVMEGFMPNVFANFRLRICTVIFNNQFDERFVFDVF